MRMIALLTLTLTLLACAPQEDQFAGARAALGDATPATEEAVMEPEAVAVEAEPVAREPIVPASDPNAERTAAIRGYLASNFAATTWYPGIRDVSVRGDTVTVQIPTLDDRTQRQTSTAICQAVSGYVFDNQHADQGLRRIRVVNAGSRAVSDRRGLGGSC
jgi:hypothetical protein